MIEGCAGRCRNDRWEASVDKGLARVSAVIKSAAEAEEDVEEMVPGGFKSFPSSRSQRRRAVQRVVGWSSPLPPITRGLAVCGGLAHVMALRPPQITNGCSRTRQRTSPSCHQKLLTTTIGRTTRLKAVCGGLAASGSRGWLP